MILTTTTSPRSGRLMMQIAEMPHELIRWTSRRSGQIPACRTELEHEYVTAVDDQGTLKFALEVSEKAGAKLNGIAAKVTRPPARPSSKQARPLSQLRAWWKTSAVLTSGVESTSSTPTSSAPVPQPGRAGPGREDRGRRHRDARPDNAGRGTPVGARLGFLEAVGSGQQVAARIRQVSAAG
jgi:hypothetical protein